MNNYKSNNHVPALAEQESNYFSPKNIANSLNGVKEKIVGSFEKNNPTMSYYAQVLNEELQGSIENFGKNPLPIAAVLTGGVLVLSAPAIEKVVNSVFNTNYNESQSIAAELQQKPYQIFDSHVDIIKYTNENMWNMEQEFGNDPRFQNFESTLDKLLGYSKPNHKLLMDLDKIISIKFYPDNTEGGYTTTSYVGNMVSKSAINTGKIFNIPDGVEIEEYMNPILKDAFYFGGKLQKLLKERENEADKKAKENKLIETRQGVISAAQEEKQETIDNFVSGNINSVGTIGVYDLKGFRKQLNVYKITDADGLLEALTIPDNATVRFAEQDGIYLYNIVLDSEDTNDGRIKITPTTDGFIATNDVPDSPKGRRLVSIIPDGLDLGELVTTMNVKAVISKLIVDKKDDYNIFMVRNLEDSVGCPEDVKPSSSMAFVPKKMDVEVGQISENNTDGTEPDYDGAEFKFPKSFDRDVGDSGTPEIPIEPIDPVIYLPSPEQELNDNNNTGDPANTGCDPNTGEGSTQTDPVVNTDSDPHIF